MSETARTSNGVPMVELGRAGALDTPVVNSADSPECGSTMNVFAPRCDFENHGKPDEREKERERRQRITKINCEEFDF